MNACNRYNLIYEENSSTYDIFQTRDMLFLVTLVSVRFRYDFFGIAFILKKENHRQYRYITSEKETGTYSVQFV